MQDLEDGLDVMPSITMENNVIHNNEGHGVILVKPADTKIQTNGGTAVLRQGSGRVSLQQN